MTQKRRQERVRMRSERWQLLGGNLLTSLSMPLALSPNRTPGLFNVPSLSNFLTNQLSWHWATLVLLHSIPYLVKRQDTAVA